MTSQEMNALRVLKRKNNLWPHKKGAQV